MVRVLKQLLQHFYHEVRIQSWHPRVLEGLSTNLSRVCFDVGMIDFSNEFNLRALEWVVVAEVSVHNESSTFIWRSLRATNDYVPLGDVVIHYLNLDSRYWILVEITQLFRQSF